MPNDRVRIGILGAARIAPLAVVRPARKVTEVEVVAVAARDPARAESFSRKHRIPRAHRTYDDLLADPEVDAVYNPLPNGLHCEWTIRALEAGKHVLCEKPIASNAAEAEQMAEAAGRTGRILVEAFHYRYHPLARRLLEIVRSGELGTIRHVEAHLCVPMLLPGDIRYRWDLAGGATMDVGCYTISLVRLLAESEPEVIQAEARLSSEKVDRYMAADFRFTDGRTGRISCSLLSSALLRVSARVDGEDGRMTVLNPWAPQYFHRLRVRTARGSRTERVNGESTYTHQLRAFGRLVLHGEPMETAAADAVRNMKVIDAVYEAAGLPKRGTP